MSTCQGCGTELAPSRGGPARKWCSDRCRKQMLYSGVCIDCGARTNGSNGRGPNAAKRCRACFPAAAGETRKMWTRDACILAIQEWAAEHGEPPAVKDWWSRDPDLVCGDRERAERYGALRDAGVIPHALSVIRACGSWSEALRLAGFEPRAPHGGDGNSARRRSSRKAAA